MLVQKGKTGSWANRFESISCRAQVSVSNWTDLLLNRILKQQHPPKAAYSIFLAPIWKARSSSTLPGGDRHMAPPKPGFLFESGWALSTPKSRQVKVTESLHRDKFWDWTWSHTFWLSFLQQIFFSCTALFGLGVAFLISGGRHSFESYFLSITVPTYHGHWTCMEQGQNHTADKPSRFWQ